MKFTFNLWMFAQGVVALLLVAAGHPYIAVIAATIRIRESQ